MKAYLFAEPGKGQVVDKPVPEPKSGSVLVKVASCGVCGTDFHILAGTEPAARQVVLGHEFAGTVVALGEGVQDLSVGDHVAIDPNITCGHCAACRVGEVNLCANLQALGVDIDGGFAEYCLVPTNQLYHIPASLSWDAASLVEPLACAIHGIDRADIRPGESVLLIGGGPIGLLMVQLARSKGAARVWVSERSAFRRQKALALGADEVLDPSAGEPAEQLQGREPDRVIECVGLPQTQEQAVRAARRGGTVLLFGCGPVGQTFPVGSYEIYSRELTIRGAALNPFTHGRAVEMIAAGRIDAAGLVTRTLSLEDLPSLLLKGPAEQDLKVVVHPAA